MLLVIIIINSILFGQEPHSSPISPNAKKPTSINLNVMLGIGQNSQIGSFVGENCNCIFDGGVGTGYTFGIHYERELFDYFFWAAGFRLQNMSFESKFIDYQTKEAFPVDEPNAKAVTVTIPISQEADLNLSSIGFNPYFKYFITDFLILQSGLNLAYIYSSNFKHEELLINRLTSDGKYIISLSQDGNSNFTIYDGPQTNLTKFQAQLHFNISGNIKLGSDNFTLQPGIEYFIPLTQLSPKYDYSVQGWRLLLQFKIALAGRKSRK